MSLDSSCARVFGVVVFEPCKSRWTTFLFIGLLLSAPPSFGWGQGISGLERFSPLEGRTIRIAPRQPGGEQPPPTPVSAIQKLRAVLERPLDFDLEKLPIKEFANWFGQQTGLNVELDQRSLKAAGVIDERVTLQQKQLRAGAGLRYALRTVGLTWTWNGDSLQITTMDEAENRPVPRIYDVADLAWRGPQDDGGFDFVPVMDLIKATCAVPKPGWPDGTGPGPLREHPAGLLLVVQCEEVHQQIDELLATLRRVHSRIASTPAPTVLDHELATSPTGAKVFQRIHATLQRPISCEIQKQPLDAVLRLLAKQTGVPFQLDVRSLEALGIPCDAPVSVVAKDRPLKFVLEQLLNPIQLTFTFRDDLLTILSPDEADIVWFTVIYPIRDLLSPDATPDLRMTEQAAIANFIRLATNNENNITRDIGDAEILVVHAPWRDHETTASVLSDLRAKLPEIRQRFRTVVDERPKTLTLIVARSDDGSLQQPPDVVAKTIKQLLPTIDWNAAAASLHVLPDRLIVRHNLNTLRKIQALADDELRGWFESSPRGGLF